VPELSAPDTTSGGSVAPLPSPARSDVAAGTDSAAPAQQLRHGRVLVVDDSPAFLQAAASVVSAAPGLRLVGVSASGEEAIRLLPEVRPDLVLLDVHMPGLDGLETAPALLAQRPDTVVVLVSADPAGLTAVARSAGAVALLGKAELCPSALQALWQKHRPGT
jgi:DNA-binding NarL/FixJ family response regulator